MWYICVASKCYCCCIYDYQAAEDDDNDVDAFRPFVVQFVNQSGRFFVCIFFLCVRVCFFWPHLTLVTFSFSCGLFRFIFLATPLTLVDTNTHIPY